MRGITAVRFALPVCSEETVADENAVFRVLTLSKIESSAAFSCVDE